MGTSILLAFLCISSGPQVTLQRMLPPLIKKLGCAMRKFSLKSTCAQENQVARRNCASGISNPDKVRILDTEQDYFVRGVKEAIYIRANKPSLNRDGGRFRLSGAFDALLTSSRFRIPEIQRRASEGVHQTASEEG